MENNTFKLNKSYFSFTGLIKKAFNVVSHIADKKNITLVMQTVSTQEIAYYEQIYGDENRFL